MKNFNEKIIPVKNTEYATLFLKMIESDSLLLCEDLRFDRLLIYEPWVSRVSKEISESITDCYNSAKLDYASSDDEVFELILGYLNSSVNSFWLLLVRAVYFIKSIDISLFIEKMIINYKFFSKQKNFNFLSTKISLEKYLDICIDDEYNLFCFVFPTLFKKLNLKRTVSIEKIVLDEYKNMPGNTKVICSRSNENILLSMNYLFDGTCYTAVINIPNEFPYKIPRIKFDYKSTKCALFYLKLNEMLTKTTKFTEIFLSWEANLDSRFFGHKECLICYFILHPASKSFSEFSCGNCKNNFHKQCILEWFNTSKSRSCPFCRMDIEYS